MTTNEEYFQMKFKRTNIDDKSSKNLIKYFEGAKVQSCAYVVLNNGLPQSIPHFQKPYLGFSSQMKQSSEKESLYQYDYKQKNQQHVSIEKKTLVPYHPSAFRNRIQLDDLKVRRSNVSNIMIGDRSLKNDRHYISVSQNHIGNFSRNKNYMSMNQGLRAIEARLHKSRIEK